MTKYSILQHDDEEKIAAYCAEHDIEFVQANAYDVTLETFKEHPIMRKKYNEATNETEEHDITQSVARTIEANIRTIDRIADKVILHKEKLKTENRNKNIKKAELENKPDLDKLADNLYRLNIVDKHSYLALVCFLMQLKYSRNHEFLENDKTCVFFNGVARNGKSATAKAICNVEAQYGEVFSAQSGKLLESTHEEQVWKSHLNYFDEVKPTDINRELLLNIVNGGKVELNPKNKRPYSYNVNTNNIFTSNDQINLMQRRVSIIKFGNRLNGRPIGNDTLKEIITNIMNSLPNFDQYYNLYHPVSIHNENCLNPLAIESILTFLNTRFNHVTEDKPSTLCQYTIFTAGDIYSCIKDSYNKQIIPTERRDAIKNALQYFVEQGLMWLVKYKTSTTKNFKITGENYLKIMEEYSKLNTKDEKNDKISLNDLKDVLRPYFDSPDSEPQDQKEEYIEHTDVQDTNEAQTPSNQKPEAANEGIPIKDFYDPYWTYNYTKPVAKILYKRLIQQIDTVIDNLPTSGLFTPLDDIMKNIIEEFVTRDMCDTISLGLLTRILKSCLPDFDEKYEALLRERYSRECCFGKDGNINFEDDRKARTVEDLQPVQEQTYTSFTPQNDGSLLAETLPSARKPSDNETDYEYQWELCQLRYIRNMKIRNDKLAQLFQEHAKFLSANDDGPLDDSPKAYPGAQ